MDNSNYIINYKKPFERKVTIKLREQNINDQNIDSTLKLINNYGVENIGIKKYSSFDLINQICENFTTDIINDSIFGKLQIYVNSLEDHEALLKIIEKQVMTNIVIFHKVSMDTYLKGQLSTIELNQRMCNNYFIKNYKTKGILAILELKDKDPKQLKNVVEYLEKNWTKHKFIDKYIEASQENQQALIGWIVAFFDTSNLSPLLNLLKDNTITAEALKSAIDPKSPFSSVEDIIKIIPGFKENYLQSSNDQAWLRVITQKCHYFHNKPAYVFTEAYLQGVAQKSLSQYLLNDFSPSIRQLIQEKLSSPIGEFSKKCCEIKENFKKNTDDWPKELLEDIGHIATHKQNISSDNKQCSYNAQGALDQKIQLFISNVLFSRPLGTIFSKIYQWHIEKKLFDAIYNAKDAVNNDENGLKTILKIIAKKLNPELDNLYKAFDINKPKLGKRSAEERKYQDANSQEAEQEYKKQQLDYDANEQPQDLSQNNYDRELIGKIEME